MSWKVIILRIIKLYFNCDSVSVCYKMFKMVNAHTIVKMYPLCRTYSSLNGISLVQI